MTRILLIDDDQALTRTLELQLRGEGYAVTTAHRCDEGLERLRNEECDVVFMDQQLPDGEGIELLKQFRQEEPELPVVMITGQQDMQTTIEAMRGGAFDFVRKPFTLADLLVILEKLRQQAERNPTLASIEQKPGLSVGEIVGNDPAILEIIKQIGRLSRSQVNVLILGESGTGKEMVARVLHHSTSPAEPFVAVNCTGIVATLLESELFGHEKGSFTGALKTKPGKFELAGNGTIFLDEVGDLPLDLQGKLLRVLQEQEFERVGGLETLPLRARVVAATHRNLEQMVSENTFRHDLYYRLNVSALHLPPLRERVDDIPLLVNHLLVRISTRLHRQVRGIDSAALAKLQRAPWTGNVRELENVLTRAVALSPSDVIRTEDLEFKLPHRDGDPFTESDEVRPLRDVERAYIRSALQKSDWNITLTAQRLQISPTTLRKKIADYQLK